MMFPKSTNQGSQNLFCLCSSVGILSGHSEIGTLFTSVGELDLPYQHESQESANNLLDFRP